MINFDATCRQAFESSIWIQIISLRFKKNHMPVVRDSYLTQFRWPDAVEVTTCHWHLVLLYPGRKMRWSSSALRMSTRSKGSSAWQQRDLATGCASWNRLQRQRWGWTPAPTSPLGLPYSHPEEVVMSDALKSIHLLSKCKVNWV